MKILLDFLPLVFFFAAFKLWGIFVATGMLMTATAAQMAIVYAIDKKLTALHKATLGLILVFGALTLLLHDERFVKIKPTVLYTGIALVLAAAQWIWHKNLLKAALGSQLVLPDAVWHRLGAAWVVYCLFMAALNAYVVLFYSTAAWAAFKLWGYIFPVTFIIGQGIYVARYIETPPDKSSEEPGSSSGETP